MIRKGLCHIVEWGLPACAFGPWAIIMTAGVCFALVTFAWQAQPSKTQTPAKAPAKTATWQAAPRDPRAEAIRLNNLGAAYMNQQRLDKALAAFRQARALDAKLTAAGVNEGIALLNMQRIEPARAVLTDFARRFPENPRVWFNLGLLSKNSGETEQAIAAFERVAQLAPEDADVRYMLGALHAQAQRYDQAIAAFEQALKLVPHHASAEFGLAGAWRRKGDQERARQHFERFQHLTEAKISAPLSPAYGEQGALSLAEHVAQPAGPVSPALPVRFVAVPATQSGLSMKPSGAVASQRRLASATCFFDFDKDGREDLFIGAQLFRNVAGRFVDVTRTAGLAEANTASACAAGDFDNDGWTDLALLPAQGVVLLRNSGNGSFAKLGGITADTSDSSGLMFVDYDHDGDLDLYVLRQAQGRNVLLRNNGNGTFTEWAEQAGLAGEAGRTAKAVATDLNNDRAVDVITTGAEGRPIAYLNGREGPFERRNVWGGGQAGLVRDIAVLDFDKDGWMDVALAHEGEPGLTIWRNVRGQSFSSVPLPRAWSQATSVVTLDFDNDGWLDIGAVARSGKEEGLVLLRNQGPQGFADASGALSKFSKQLATADHLAISDYDLDGDTDILVVNLAGAPLLLRNDGGNRNHAMRLALSGLADNKSAIGTKVEVFAGALYQKFEVTSPNALLIGLGRETQADIVRLLWPGGVLQDEVNVSARTTQKIGQLDRRGSSCPLLFAWDGARYRFIADMIGPGILGHWVGPGQYNVPDPTEYLKVESSAVRPRNGRLSFRFAEPMEEVVYLDQARLLAIDHPADTEVFPNEYFASHPPFPEFRVVTSHGARLPAAAWDDAGRNVLPELRARDRRYVTSLVDAPFRGFTKLHALELDLGEAVALPLEPLRLLMSGFTDYASPTSMYAAHQAGVALIVPYLEARDAAGRWVRVSDDIGFPAGMARTMVADLTGKLPAGTQRIRIWTNLKIFWDQILIDRTPQVAGHAIREVPMAGADLRYAGYMREIPGNPPSDADFSYEQISITGPFARHAGNYTRYGDVSELVSAVDDRFAVFGSGEEIAIEFDATALPTLPRGWKRDYFFFVHGYCKDMDFFAPHGLTVAPLPLARMPGYPDPRPQTESPALDYFLEVNSRFVSERSATRYRFEFPPRQKNP